MLAAETINVPVLIDGPCNEWWLNFGTNPNCAYFVDPDGYIYDAQDWFDNYPNDIYSSIDNFLGLGGGTSDYPIGHFILNAFNEDTVYGNINQTITSTVTIANDDILDSYIDNFILFIYLNQSNTSLQNPRTPHFIIIPQMYIIFILL